ncbi:hypothetical protein D3C72_1067470 [compost metagenome]
MQALHAGHARQVHVLDDFQASLEQLDADAERFQAEAGRLDQHDEAAGRQFGKCGQHGIGRDLVEIDEGRVRQGLAIRFRQHDVEPAALVADDQGRFVRAVADGHGQQVGHVLRGHFGGGGADGV